MSEETKKKIGDGNRGKKLSEETKRKIGMANAISLKGNIPASKTHGLSHTVFWNKWVAMRMRCFNLNNHAYDNYGGRGITVCKKWLNFQNFKDDMYDGYLKHCEEYGARKTTLDRINNNGNYEPSNCRWATPKEQVKNRRMENILNHKRNKLGQYE